MLNPTNDYCCDAYEKCIIEYWDKIRLFKYLYCQTSSLDPICDELPEEMYISNEILEFYIQNQRCIVEYFSGGDYEQGLELECFPNDCKRHSDGCDGPGTGVGDDDNDTDIDYGDSCFSEALEYIDTHLLADFSNACEVYDYVMEHFNCLDEDPDDTLDDHDDTEDDWEDDGGNDGDPVEEGYDESQRKPIWWYHSDHLGSSSYITDNFGRPSHYYEYLPFGELMTEHNQSKYYLEPYPTQNMDSYNNPYKFNGKEMDKETGMYYYGARYYDPRISIFVSVDPLAESTMTPYQYVYNNPINMIDPTGMAGEDWVEDTSGNITWRCDVNKDNYKDVLQGGEIYRGTSYQRERIWTNVDIGGNSESGLMKETYNPCGTMTYDNLTPWIDTAFEEFNKGISETGSNPEIMKYWTYTQMPEAAKQNNADGAYARAVMKADKESWCAAFVNWTLETSGVNGTMHALAYSFKGWGQNLEKAPVYGSIAVMNYSHVGYVVGQNPNGSIILLGGNQPGDSVNLNPTERGSILQARYPTGYTPTTLPLPKMNVQRGSMSYGNTR